MLNRNGELSLDGAQTIEMEGRAPIDFAFIDADGDPHPDLMILATTAPVTYDLGTGATPRLPEDLPTDRSLFVARFDPARARYGALELRRPAGLAHRLEVVDLDHDGLGDALLADGETLVVARGVESGT